MSVKLHVVMAIPGKDPREFDYEFGQTRISLGRDEDNDIQIPLSTVSRNHAVLYEERGEWYLEDLKSTHGTRHNGRQVGAGGKKLLRSGDVIEVVHFRITFSQGAGLSEGYSEGRTEALAQRMVQEVLASMGREGNAPYLRVMNGPDEGTQHVLDASVPEVVIGRGNDCDFQINDANISRRHAVVRMDWNDITIEDLGSKNGVVINERKISGRASLRDADEILLGAVRLTFIDPSAKFIGKLDDIPAFQDAARPGDDLSVSSVDSLSLHMPRHAPAEEVSSGEPVAPLPELESAAGSEPGDGPPSPEDSTSLGDEADDGVGELSEDGPEGSAHAPTGPLAERGLGWFEYGAIALAALVVLGLVVGVVLVLG